MSDKIEAMDGTEPWHGLNGASVIAHDTHTGSTYIRLPLQLQRQIDGGCSCAFCKRNSTVAPVWDTLVVPTNGTAWTVHMPDAAEFCEYLKRKCECCCVVMSKGEGMP